MKLPAFRPFGFSWIFWSFGVVLAFLCGFLLPGWISGLLASFGVAAVFLILLWEPSYKTKIILDPDDHDYPVAAVCGRCCHQYSIDPVLEENLVLVRPISDPRSRVLTTQCPMCRWQDPVP